MKLNWPRPNFKIDLSKKYQRVLLGSALSFVVSCTSLLLSLHFFAAPWLKTQLETRASEYVAGEVKIGSLSFSLIPSFGIQLHEVTFKSEEHRLKGKLDELSAYLDTQLISLLEGGSMMRIRIKAKHPVIETQEDPPVRVGSREPPPGQGPATMRIAVIHSPRPMSLVLDVTQGEITRLPYDLRQPPNTLRGFEFSVHVPDINKYQAQLDFASIITWEKNGIAVPLDLKISSGMELRETTIVLADIQGSVNGIISKGSLSFDLLGGPRELKLSGSVSEIADLATPPPFLPTGKWKGSCQYQLHLESENELSEWTGGGSLTLKGLNGSTQLAWPNENPELTLNGFISSELQLDYTLAASPHERKGGPLAETPLELSAMNRLKIDHLKFWLDLSQAEIEKKNSFHKPLATPLIFDIEGTGTSDQIHIAEAHFQFASLKSSGSGDWLVRNPKSSVDVLGWHLKVEPTDLADWDKYFTIFTGSPVHGKFQLDTSFSGDLRHLDQLNLALHPLLLDQVEGNIHWHSVDGQESFSGPVKIDGKLDFENRGTDLKFNEAKLNVDLTKLDMQIKDAFNKIAGTPVDAFSPGCGATGAD